MSKIHKNLCKRSSTVNPCGYCTWNITDPLFLRRLDLHNCLGLVISILTQIIDSNEQICLESSTCSCKGYTNITTRYTSRYYMQPMNMAYCKFIFELWRKTIWITTKDNNRVEFICKVVDQATTPSDLLFKFDIIFNSNAAWRD